MSRRMIRTQPHSGGWLEVVCGPMFSGKSEELIRGSAARRSRGSVR